jgi:hypothetical protein
VLTATFKILADTPSAPLQTIARAPRPRSRAEHRAAGARSKHDPHRDDPTVVSDAAFAQARDRMPLGYGMALTLILADRFAREQQDALRWKQFRLLALDGTLIDLPCQGRLADCFGVARGRRGGRSPQARLVMLQFPLARVPYRYALEPRRQAEKAMAGPLLEALQEGDLVLMDRGFWSYGLFCRIAGRSAHFAIREIAQARLRPVRTLGPEDTLVRYAPSDRKWPALGLPPAMDLRRIAYQVRGFRPGAVITNVTDPAVISRDEWVGMATGCAAGHALDPALYHRRWQIQTSFSELKVIQRIEALRGRMPESIRYELSGHLLLYLMVRWLMVEAAQASGQDPLRLSFTGALREVRVLVVALTTSSAAWARHVLLPRLLKRIAGHVVPHRPGRHYPRPNDTRVRDVGYGQKKQPSKLIG